MDIDMRNERINRILNPIALIAVSVLLVLSIPPVPAKSRTGLESTLITEWHSQINRDNCSDFRYPSHQPSIIAGKKVYFAKCAKCHGAEPVRTDKTIGFMRKRTPEKQYEAVCGSKIHKKAGKLTVDERWDSLMYMRAHILGYFPKNSPAAAEMDSIFGGNCAICHGTRGQGDGNLHKKLLPPPANFTMFKRLYTRTDEKLFNEISYGIPWTGMPAWKDRHDFDKQQNFSPELIWRLVRYVRSFGYSQDLDRLDKGRANLEKYKKSVGL